MNPYGSALNRSQSLASGLEKWTKAPHSRSSSTLSSRHSRQVIKDWEVIDDAQLEVTAAGELSAPGMCEGYLLKRRKWPLKGWHKRYFVLEGGILRYCRNQQDVSIGRVQGSVDISNAVMSINKKSNRIDLDAGDILYHMKAKSHELFYIWVTKLQAHRSYRKSEAAVLPNGHLASVSADSSRSRCFSSELLLLPVQSAVGVASVAPPSANNKVSAWLQQSHPPDTCAQELNRCHLDLSELNRLIQRLQLLEAGPALTNGELQRIISTQNLSLEKPKKPKPGRVQGHSRTLSRVEALGLPVRRMTKSLSSSPLTSSSHFGASVPSIPDYVYSQLSPSTSTSAEGKKIQQDICAVSLRVLTSLQSVHHTLCRETHKLQEVWEDNHEAAAARRLSQRPASVAESATEFFDASDDILFGSSSDVSEESGLSDGSTSNSEPEEGHESVTRKYRASISRTPHSVAPRSSGRRTTLPAACPDNSHVGLMAILYNNIGKDLARVSMPAALNEPVNLLQRLCEELEYSQLLDTASNTPDPFQRMVYIAAFAISGYSTAAFRSRYKPFNPVLGETYECVREDRGFCFVSEQVCHHPPISACHADSDNFSFWQDQRWKNKFWGKSLEIVPTGMVNVTLPRYRDHYEWNKVVTCIHNVLSQQRYLEHYGEVTIRNLKSNACTCKITFVKSRYWGSEANKNEVQGTVLDQSGSVVHRFGGLWHEGIFCDTLPTPKCVWKPNPQPKDHLLYYGFSSFAMELNELTPDLRPLLPPTDTRLRPDQRLLEEGQVDETDRKKDEIEERQREMRKELGKKGEEHVPAFFKKAKDCCGRDVWLTKEMYWKLRKDPGFANMASITLW
ncbi:oxysterol-binding protein-related protein 7 isoform X2 [Entelurus aequoreus]|uniref:oxysterol-binding protein-related protein 7 isoform X1 n=1 Tax=Entelurus aequoreus TaxID=161455 RepID=UPI002B1E73A1|nr:oxysterol-binding protein-related protein 7 isoform X1 [Entelurus aequoreus]XP_061912879.1 oxysterol-binding protein-related protein 7 isoform X2 [Entelurus aequoreus]